MPKDIVFEELGEKERILLLRAFDYDVDSEGFIALPGGYSGTDGSFNMLNSVGAWWCLEAYNSTDGIDKYMRYSHANVGSTNNDKNNGYSVRCVRDI